MTILLILGLIIGIRHSLEPDHVAAVLVLSTQSKSLSATAKQGAMWGIGHTITLLIFSMMLIGLQIKIGESVFILFEVAAGLIVIMMGFDALNKTRNIYYQRKNEKGNAAITEAHNKTKLSLRALGIGLLHGAAGSGVIIALVTTTLDSIYLKFTYIALFSIGLILSMALLSLLMSIPLYRGIKYLHTRYLQIATGTLAILIGMKILYDFGAQMNTLIT